MLKISYWKCFFTFLICLLAVYVSIPSLVNLNQNGLGKFFPSAKVNLGLDLRGGSYLLIEAMVDSYELETFNRNSDILKSAISREPGVITNFNIQNKDLYISLAKPDSKEKAIDIIKHAVGSYFIIQAEKNGNSEVLHLTINDQEIETLRKNVISQSIEIVRRRVDETGTKEVDLQRQGENYILLQVPGMDDPAQLKTILGKTAKLSLHLVPYSTDEASGSSIKTLPLDSKDGQIRMIPIYARPIITGDMLTSANAVVRTDTGQPIIEFKLNTIGAKLFADTTSKNTGKSLAIVLDGKVISAPSISEPIMTGSGQISGNFTVASANELALLLRAGSLPVPLKIIEERTVGPSLGSDSIEAGKNATILGFVLVVVFMFIFYYFFGLIANLALFFNLFLIIAILAIFGATLTMPGIAGIVLTLGMAVDANVLIFERIREELAKGRTAISAIDSGYKMAFNTIFDSNITTILVGVILYAFGTGPIKGFAVTMIVGIASSMFTAVTLSKVIVSIWYRKYKPKTINI